MLLPDIEDNKLNILIDKEVERSIEYCSLILLEFQLFLRIILFQTFKLELTFQRLWDQGRIVMSKKTSKMFLKIFNSYFKTLMGMIF